MISSNPTKKIQSIDFGLFEPEEIRKGSVCNVLHSEILEYGVPKEDGLLDLRMGTTDKKFLCKTCGMNMNDCVGHFGHIELSRPMYHIGYLNQIKKVLECVCYYCSRLKSDIHGNGTLEKSWEKLKGKMVCGLVDEKGERVGCGNKQPYIRREGLSFIRVMKSTGEGDGRERISAKQIYKIFKKIREEDLGKLGFNPLMSKPEDMLINVVVVSPPCMRPSVVSSGLRAEDDLTYKYADIIKANNLLRKYESEGSPRHIINDYEQLLQYHVYTLFNNEASFLPTATHKSGRPIKSIGDRIKGKEGRIRGSLMGKRVDFSARTVITPSSSIELDEVGIPVSVAKIHTFPEKVTEFNKASLQALVDAGPNKHPGANYVIRTDGRKIDLRYNRHELYLEIGFTVERHLKNGDFVVFNRQPSLHKFSMMTHRVKVLHTGKTFRLNLSATSPYNADFDGDEMNIHSPQNYVSKAELKSLSLVSNIVTSPQSNKPVIGLVQDSLIGVRLISLKDTFFTRREASILFYAIEEDEPFNIKPAISHPVELWTGKQLVSWILPPLFYDRPCTDKSCDPRVKIINGVLLTGVLDKVSCGATQGGIIHIIFNDFGALRAKTFINKIQSLITSFLSYVHSFSVGIGDATVDHEVVEQCKRTIRTAMKDVDQMIVDAKKGTLQHLPGLSLFSTFESQVQLILNKARDLKKEISPKNNLNAMILSGSKGSTINTCQITSCVGQQSTEGSRIGFRFRYRTLPHFTRYDYSSAARGFVLNSYMTGLYPHEFFFHAIGGREGIIDTAIKTSDTGYIQRRLGKSMEDACVAYDYSVRNADGSIYEFSYGDDRLDAKKLESVSLTDERNLEDFKELFFIDMFLDSRFEVRNVTDEIYKLMKNDFELQKRLDDEYDFLFTNRGLLKEYVTPVNVQRILMRLSSQRTDDVSDINPYDVLAFLNEVAVTDNVFLNYYLRHSLAIKKILRSLNSALFQTAKDEIRRKLEDAKIPPHEMVGVLAAQSIGQPATQMTLNTFHLAGVASTIVSGVPRLTEIINVVQNPKTPVSYIHLSSATLADAQAAKNSIEFCTLRDFCSAIDIVYDPHVSSTVIPEDAELVAEYFEMPDEKVNFDSLSSIVIRLTINSSLLVSRGIEMEFLVDRIYTFMAARDFIANVIYSENTETPSVIRIRIAEKDKCWSFYQKLLDDLLDFYVSGVKGIKKAYLVESKTLPGSWLLQTNGINFPQILSLENVDCRFTTVNNPLQIFLTLGIEAARAAVLHELISVIESSGSYVNYRHLGLLADIMTSFGHVAGITRHGVSYSNSKGVLNRASFEQPLEIFFQACISASSDRFAGISENIMAGQPAPCGTGKVNVLLDSAKLMEMRPVTEESVFDSITQAMSTNSCFSSEFSQLDFSSESICGGTHTASKMVSPDYPGNPRSTSYQDYSRLSTNYRVVSNPLNSATYYSPRVNPASANKFSMTSASHFYASQNRFLKSSEYTSIASSPASKFTNFIVGSGGRYRPGADSPGSYTFNGNSPVYSTESNRRISYLSNDSTDYLSNDETEKDDDKKDVTFNNNV